MSSHRAVVFSIAALSLYFSAAPAVTAFAATASSTPADSQYLYVAHTTAATVQNSGTENVLVYRNGSTSGAASVLCQTANNTAIAGRDFTAVSTTLHWGIGDAAPKLCSVSLSDAAPFSGPRTFFVELSDATGAALSASNKVTVTIYGNKGGGAVSVAASSYTVAQSAGHVTISVDRTGGSVGQAVVYYATANMTAIAGTDYTSEQGQLAWGNGDAAPKSFSIPISNAKPFSGTKTLAIAIAHGINVDLGSPTSAIVTIDGDAASATGTATLSWAAPTTNTNGTPVTPLSGYHVYYGTSQSAMTESISVSAGTTTCEITALGSGTWYFAVAAVAADGTESAKSNIGSKTI
ncbi:MAG: Calx-beta domain-containing protein [Steroidobacteraceae bacterium]